MFERLARMILQAKGYSIFTQDEVVKFQRTEFERHFRTQGYKPLTKEIATRIRRGDYIPLGNDLSVDSLAFFPTGEHEVYFCSQHTGHDVQSGPFYCGDVASHVAFGSNGEVICLCDRHMKKHSSTLKAA